MLKKVLLSISIISVLSAVNVANAIQCAPADKLGPFGGVTPSGDFIYILPWDYDAYVDYWSGEVEPCPDTDNHAQSNTPGGDEIYVVPWA